MNVKTILLRELRISESLIQTPQRKESKASGRDKWVEKVVVVEEGAKGETGFIEREEEEKTCGSSQRPALCARREWKEAPKAQHRGYAGQRNGSIVHTRKLVSRL